MTKYKLPRSASGSIDGRQLSHDINGMVYVIEQAFQGLSKNPSSKPDYDDLIAKARARLDLILRSLRDDSAADDSTTLVTP
ncbi:MAG: hypothetical protein K2X47_16555 [Bdellovibrionales bacterium]|nr:hypothetical protein [Bdellovibrionales bacterium]